MQLPFFKKQPVTQAVEQARLEPEFTIEQSQVAAPTSSQTKRHQMHAQRFAAAKSDRIQKGFLGGAGLSVDETLRRDLERLRSASRKAGEDIGYMKRYYGMVQTHVVGDTGVRLQAEVRNKNGDLDKEVNDDIEAAFKDWGKIGTCEISGRMNLISAEQLIAKTTSQDGDILIRHIDGADNKYGYAFQLIEADLLDAQLYKTLDNGNRIKMGVEVDGYGRHIAYHILTSHPGEYTWKSGNRRYERIPASQIILPFPMWRPGQNRGIPWAHASLLDMHDISSYRESVMVSGRIAASNMLLYERDPEQQAPDAGDDEDWDESGDFNIELDPGSSAIVPEGYKIKETNFQHKGDTLGEFQKASLRGGASGAEVNYNVMGNDYEGVSWSSLRQAILEDREHWKRMQGWFISQVMGPIYERWIRNALLKNAINNLKAYDLNRSLSYTFRGRRWQWVDPLNEEKAAGAAMDNFTANPLDILNDKGVDLEQMAEGWGRYLKTMAPHIALAQSMGLGKQIKAAVAAGELPEPIKETKA
jgi:lambda family phage portal protein